MADSAPTPLFPASYIRTPGRNGGYSHGAAFHIILDELTLPLEGGWYDGKNKRDPNPTMKGVIQKTYDAYRARKGLHLRSVKEIEHAELHDIYLSIWYAAKCPVLFEVGGFALASTAFDFAVTSGPDDPTKTIQSLLSLKVDGVFGPKTEAAVLASSWARDKGFAHRFTARRLKFYTDLAAKPDLLPNLRSWNNRIVQWNLLYG